MPDVILEDAVIAVKFGPKGKATEVRVLPHLDPRVRHYEFTAGACDARWQEWPDHRLGILHEILWCLVLTFEVGPAMIHEALQIVPEYRELEGNAL